MGKQRSLLLCSNVLVPDSKIKGKNLLALPLMDLTTFWFDHQHVPKFNSPQTTLKIELT